MTPTTRARILAVITAGGMVLVLAGCSSGTNQARPGRTPAVNAVPVATVTSAPLLNADGPYPVVQLFDAQTVQLDRGPHGGGLTTVRLLGAVTPGPARCFEAEATDEAHRLLDGQRVRIVSDPGPSRLDAEGQPLVYLWLDSGRMANHLLVEDGFAREAVGAPPYLYRDTFAGAEERARQEARGLWGTPCDGNITMAGS